ncbi:MAG: glycosyltransferase, partial [Chloroflexota bacterium]
LNSALGQTYSNLEIVVSDNASPDNTEQYVKSFNDPRIRYYKQDPALKPNENFNFCLEQAQGAYFLLFHDDDIIDEDFISSCLQAADYQTDFGIIRTGTRVIDDNGQVIKEQPNFNTGNQFSDLLKNWFTNKTMPYLCSTLFNTKLLKEIGGFGSKHDLFQDVIAAWRLAALAGWVDIQGMKASFRIHGTTRTKRSSTIGWREDSLELLDIVSREFSGADKEEIEDMGRRFMSVLNYRRAKDIPSLFERWSSYLAIYKDFGYRYAPWTHFLKPKRRKIKRNLVGVSKNNWLTK